ncbi:hypothetical protein H490_0110420, partial [Leucobacter sp. UCD-THU]
MPSGSLPAGALPIDGVTFTVREVTEIGGVAVDLETDAGWALIQPYLANPGSFTTAGNTLVPAGTGVTGAAGVPGELVFDSLNVGLFYVEETDAPANVSTRAQPFLVTLPMPTTEPGVFRYDVHAYPKNLATTAVKTVNDTDSYALGDVITWTVSGNIPLSPVSDYRVVDTLPAELAYAASPAPTVTIRSAAGAPVQLTSPTDFTVTPAGDVYTMELTPQGYDELWLAGDNAQVDFTIATTVTSIPSDGTITNTAKVFIDSAEFDVQAESLWGTARVNKHAQGDEDARLAGAEFQVFATEAAANAAAAQVAAGDPVTGGLEFGAGSTAGADRKTFTTADQGADHGFVVINGLKAS